MSEMPAATDRAPLAVLIVDDELFARTRLRNLVQAGLLGRKSGRGFHTYDQDGKKT